MPIHNERVVSGMRPTGRLHLGHYHGVLKNWLQLQHEFECFFFVADWHALTTEYEDTAVIGASVWDMIIDWLAVGINPGSAKLFIQSRVPEHAELHLLLSMITPLSWLERVPTYKDQQEKLKEKDLATYGFLGYPALQAADILIYRATRVPVGEDQIAHVELTRDIAGRFNHLYGKDLGFEEKAQSAIGNMGRRNAKLYQDYRKLFQETGDTEALEKAREILDQQQNLTMNDRERLFGYLEGGGKIILPEPRALTTETSKMPGLDGQKMSKSYHNTIALREDPAVVEKAVLTMPTDPARVRRTDVGDPEKCPVWNFHQVYSDEKIQEWVRQGCTTAGIGCIDCKKQVLELMQAELEPIRENALKYEQDPQLVRTIVAEGCEQAQKIARNTLEEVREAMGLINR